MSDAKKMLIFSTMPSGKDNNNQIAISIFQAMKNLGERIDAVYATSDNVIQAIEEVRPNFILGLGSIVHDSLNYESIKHRSDRCEAVLGYWVFDDPYERDYNWKIESSSDWIFTTDLNSSFFYRKQNVKHIPLGMNTESHYRDFIPIKERELDIFFCGVAYPNRRSIVSKIRHTLSSHNTIIAGEGWNAEYRFCRNTRISPTEMPNYFANAKIVINIGRQYNVANAKMELAASSPGPRTFEAAAAGALQLYYLDSMEIGSYFALGEEILTFNSVDEFASIANNVINTPSEFDQIAIAGQQRALADHSYEKRCSQILKTLAGGDLQ